MGGAEFIGAHELYEGLESCREWLGYRGKKSGPDEWWLESVPFIRIGNGDFISILMTDAKKEQPVIYLCHDGGSGVIAKSLPKFLEAWEKLCYIAPEIWSLEDFLDEYGLLDGNSKYGKEIHDILSDDVPLPKAPPSPLPTPEESQEERTRRMGIIAKCVMLFAQSNNKFPDADAWQDALQPLNHHINRMCILAAFGGPSSCFMNRQLSGTTFTDITHPEKTVLFFESRAANKNSNGTQDDVINGKPRDSHALFVTADGKVHLLNKHQQEKLKWSPYNSMN